MSNTMVSYESGLTSPPTEITARESPALAWRAQHLHCARLAHAVDPPVVTDQTRDSCAARRIRCKLGICGREASEKQATHYS